MDACGWNYGGYGSCGPCYDPWAMMPPVCDPFMMSPAAYYTPCCPPVWTPYPYYPMYGGYGYGGAVARSMWGAAAGGTVGAVLGCVAGPAGILLGGTIGAVAGAIWGAGRRHRWGCF